MLLPVILGSLALAVVFLSPVVLVLHPWQLRHPRTTLTIAYTAFVAGFVLACAAVISTILLAVMASPQGAAADTTLISISAWLVLGIVGAVTGFVLAAATSTSSNGFRTDIAVSREERDGFTLVRFQDDKPHAYALPGPHPEIFYSTALQASLSQSEFAAVIAHEYAHLRQHHGTALRITELNATCLPFLPAGRALRRATRLLIELAADDAAARQIGPAHLANALTRLAALTGDGSLALRAERLSDKSWPLTRRRRIPRALRALTTA